MQKIFFENFYRILKPKLDDIYILLKQKKVIFKALLVKH